MNQTDLNAEILLERIEKEPKLGEITKATILAKNSKGLYVDINKTYEGYINLQEIGNRKIDSFEIGEVIEGYVQGLDKNLEGCYKLSLKQIENENKWQKLESLQNQNLELKITKILKSGVEVEIESTNQIGFIPYGYVENKQEALKDTAKEDWIGKTIPGRIHELEKSKNKIILNNKVICDDLRKNKAIEVLNNLALGQTIDVEVVRITEFGAFVDLGGLDALIPSSELSWKRFKKPSDIVKVGDKLKTKVFKIESDKLRVALSVKQAEPDPWTVLPEEIKAGYQKAKAKVITSAEFGVFVEIIPGIEALLHKSNFINEKTPELEQEVDVEIINVDASKRRMGVKIISIIEKTNSHEEEITRQNQEEKELEHVK
jgi:small subunit ribosomal protein S1